MSSLQWTRAEYGAGEIIRGKYRLEKVLGEGGIGTVWLARNLVLDSVVALKLMRPGLDPDAALRLLDEARAEAQLEHRGVVRVFDFGETELGAPFIVMELLDGFNLAAWLDRRGKLEPTWAVQVLLPVIDALGAAHAQGIVHRDLKPENLFLALAGPRIQPKIVDFGIAKLCRDQTSPRRTLAGSVLGTPAYMAPEQARGLDDVDARADIWAVCVVLYEVLTGELPFTGASYNAILRAVIEDELIPLRAWGIPEPELFRIIQRGVAKDRSARYQSMHELGNELASWLHRRGVGEDITGETLSKTWKLGRRAPRVSRRFVLVSTCVASAASLVGLVVSLASPASAETESMQRVGAALAPRGLLRAFGPNVRAVPRETESVQAKAEDSPKPNTAAVRATSARTARPRWPFSGAPVHRGVPNAPLSDLKEPYR